MKKKIAVGLGTSIVVIALIMTMGLSSLFAETQSEQDNDQSFICRCGEAVEKGFGVIAEAIQKLLGMSREEIQEERQEGSSLLEIAESKDVTAEELTETILEAKKDRFEEAVEEGCLTQEQADERLELMEERIEEKINNSNCGFNGQKGGFGGFGNRLGNCNQ
ncbi:MAG: hypothetical protein H8E13_20175 [Actinobacteria bacterium]|nr:hypothetical protein [Actinomycetota bacterium]